MRDHAGSSLETGKRKRIYAPGRGGTRIHWAGHGAEGSFRVRGVAVVGGCRDTVHWLPQVCEMKVWLSWNPVGACYTQMGEEVT